MKEDRLKIYLNSINKMIRTGNPKYMSYISKQYMIYMKTNPVICEAIGDMLFKEVTKNEKSLVLLNHLFVILFQAQQSFHHLP